MSEANAQSQNHGADGQGQGQDRGQNANPENQNPGADGQGDQGAGAENGSVEIYRPEGMPDHYVGTTDQETIDALYKAVDGFRKEQSKGKNIPEKAEDYTFDVPEDLDGKIFKFDDDGKDPMLERLKPIALKHGMTKEAFGDMVLDFGQALLEFGDAGADASGSDLGENAPDFDYQAFGGEEKVKPLLDGVQVWVKGLRNADKIDDQIADEIAFASQHGAGLKMVNFFREQMGEKPIPVDMSDPVSADAMTEDKLNEMVADDRYKVGHPKFEKSFHDKVTKAFDEFYNKA